MTILRKSYICSHERKSLFSIIRNHEMILNKYGQTAHDCWLETEQIRPNIVLGDFIIMPNHMHAVFAITRRGVLHTPGITSHTQPIDDSIRPYDHHHKRLEQLFGDTNLRLRNIFANRVLMNPSGNGTTMNISSETKLHFSAFRNIL